MGLVFLPIYIQLIGIESYGLIGLIGVIQTWLALLDLGMGPTLNREMARFVSGVVTPQEIQDLLRTLEIVCFAIALLCSMLLFGLKDVLANHWLKASELPTAIVTQAIAMMSIVIGLRFCEGLYRSALLGLQRHVILNVANVVLSTIRYGGAVVVLVWYSATIESFLAWQAFVSFISVLVMAITVHCMLPRSPVQPRFSTRAIRGIGRFASGMLAISFLAVLLTQIDKVLLSKLLTLKEFAYYSLASTLTGLLYMAITPISQAIYPRLVELSTEGKQGELAKTYHRASQFIATLASPLVVVMGVFSEGVVYAWSGDTILAQNTAPVLSVLSLGTFLNCLMWIPYQCQLAHGWTSLTIRANVVAVVLLVPLIFWITPYYGPLGAAWIWVVLNCGYLLLVIRLMHERILVAEKKRWYLEDNLGPVAGALAIVFFAWFLQPQGLQHRFHWLFFLGLTTSMAAVASLCFANQFRAIVYHSLARVFLRWRISI